MSWDTNSVGFVVVFSTNQLMVDGILVVIRIVNVGGYSIGKKAILHDLRPDESLKDEAPS